MQLISLPILRCKFENEIKKPHQIRKLRLLSFQDDVFLPRAWEWKQMKVEMYQFMS